jgi:hypothetical protein
MPQSASLVRTGFVPVRCAGSPTYRGTRRRRSTSFLDSKQHLVAETLNRRGDEYLGELRQAADAAGSALERLHHIVDAATAFFGARGDFRSLLRQMQGGSIIVGPVLDAFADDVYGRYAQAMALMTRLVREGRRLARSGTGIQARWLTWPRCSPTSTP